MSAIKFSIFALAIGLAMTGCTSTGVKSGAALESIGEPSLVADKSGLDELWVALPEEMQKNALHGLSVAVFDHYKIVDVKTFGAKSTLSGEPVTENTVFSTASISKVVTALVCLKLAEDGAIDLDAPIATYLKSWKLPESEFSGAADVTWRQLLTHTAGTSQHGFADYYEGDDLPTLIDSLEGRLPRYDKPIEFLFAPGRDWQYSGGGYVIVQLALEDHTGISLPELAAREVFGPLGLQHTTMVQPGSAGFPTDAALVHDEAGEIIRTGLPITPQISASGMWSSPADLATFTIAIQRALAGDTDGPMKPREARALTDIFSLEPVGGMSMPFFRGFGFGNTDWFRHDGSNTGVNADLLGSMEGGYGIVMLGNGDDANTGPVFATLRREIIERMGWSERDPLATLPVPEPLTSNLVGTYTGLLYDLGLEYRIEEQGGRFWVVSEFFTQFLGRDRSEMHYLGENTFAIEDYPNRLRFDCETPGHECTVLLNRPRSSAEAIARPMRKAGAEGSQ